MRAIHTKHKCYLVYGDDGVIFSMEVGKECDVIQTTNVTVSGVDADFLTKEARETVIDWAQNEAIRVTSRL